MSRLARDGTTEPVSRDQILRRERGQGNINFPVQLTASRIGNLTRLIRIYSCYMCDHTYYIMHRFLRKGRVRGDKERTTAQVLNIIQKPCDKCLGSTDSLSKTQEGRCYSCLLNAGSADHGRYWLLCKLVFRVGNQYAECMRATTETTTTWSKWSIYTNNLH